MWAPVTPLDKQIISTGSLLPLFCWLHNMVPQTSHDVNETVVCIPDITSSPICNTNEWRLHCTKIDGHYPMSYDVTKLLWINSYSNSEWPTSANWHATITCHELMSTSHTQDMVFTTMIMLVCLYLFYEYCLHSWLSFSRIFPLVQARAPIELEWITLNALQLVHNDSLYSVTGFAALEHCLVRQYYIFNRTNRNRNDTFFCNFANVMALFLVLYNILIGHIMSPLSHIKDQHRDRLFIKSKTCFIACMIKDKQRLAIL